MATKLNGKLSRDIGDIGLRGGDGGEYIVTLYPSGTLGLRRKRSRKELLIPLSHCYSMAAKAEAEERRQQTADRRTRRAKRRRR